MGSPMSAPVLQLAAQASVRCRWRSCGTCSMPLQRSGTGTSSTRLVTSCWPWCRPWPHACAILCIAESEPEHGHGTHVGAASSLSWHGLSSAPAAAAVIPYACMYCALSPCTSQDKAHALRGMAWHGRQDFAASSAGASCTYDRTCYTLLCCTIPRCQSLADPSLHWLCNRSDLGHVHSQYPAFAQVGEVGELAAVFQWKSDAGAAKGLPGFTAAERLAVQHEVSDVLLYLVRLAEVCGIDLAAAALAKLELVSLTACHHSS